MKRALYVTLSGWEHRPSRQGRRAPMSKFYLGLDVHKVRTQYCLVDQEGRIVRGGSLPTEDVASLVELPGLPVVLEATGH